MPTQSKFDQEATNGSSRKHIALAQRQEFRSPGIEHRFVVTDAGLRFRLIPDATHLEIRYCLAEPARSLFSIGIELVLLKIPDTLLLNNVFLSLSNTHTQTHKFQFVFSKVAASPADNDAETKTRFELFGRNGATGSRDQV